MRKWLVVLGIAMIGLVVGIAWLWGTTLGPEDDDNSWRFRQ
jgi:hypothetical protein